MRYKATEVRAAALAGVVKEGFFEEMIFWQEPDDKKEPALGRVGVGEGGIVSNEAGGGGWGLR